MTTRESRPTEQQTREGRFVGYLHSLVEREELAALAALRRGLGKEPGTAPEMYPYVVPFVGDITPTQQAPYYLVAALFAWHQKDWPSDDPQRDNRNRNNLGASLARLRQEQARDRGDAVPDQGDSTERRFVAMLSSSREDMPYHLRQMIGLLRTKEVPVNWLQLLYDIRFWDSDDSRIVQQRWASAFWSQTTPDQASYPPSEPNGSDEDQPADVSSPFDQES